jgi:hypothetical protein
MADQVRILAFMAASTILLSLVIWLCARGAPGGKRSLPMIVGAAAAISVLGILFGKYGQNFGLPWWIYYPVPMLCTVLIPPLAFRLGWARSLAYVVLAFASAPLIHIAFSLILGWTDYMPFWKVG